MIQGFPVLVTGTTDINQHFHLLGISISTYETENDFAFMFKAVKDGIFRIVGKEFSPKFLVADAAPSIQNGFKRIFGDNNILVIMCYFHVIKNFNDRKYKRQQNKTAMKEDLEKLHYVYDDELFDIASNFYVKKWEKQEPEAIKLFSKSFLRRNRYWYNGCATRIPKTNNALESLNGSFKCQQTYWKKKSISIQSFRI